MTEGFSHAAEHDRLLPRGLRLTGNGRIPFERNASPLLAPMVRRLFREARLEATRYPLVFPASLRRLRPAERWFTHVPVAGLDVVLARRPA